MKFTHITEQSAGAITIDSPEKQVLFVHNYSGDITVDVQCEDAQVFIYGLYVGKKGDIFTLKTTQKHSTGQSLSDLLVKGVFFDDAKFEYEGLIHIVKGAQLSNAYQKNQNLVMSDGVFIDSRPFLEIEANDVRCTHGSTTGKLKQDQIQYLQDRGISSRKREKAPYRRLFERCFGKIGGTRRPRG